mmetsp:Transcript_6132/g.14158  ORF Transcript_6132/g.14158 Transcript_6132/m.14158 type:complete len:235 (+) Transcript_6132:351-1055(+)
MNAWHSVGSVGTCWTWRTCNTRPSGRPYYARVTYRTRFPRHPASSRRSRLPILASNSLRSGIACWTGQSRSSFSSRLSRKSRESDWPSCPNEIVSWQALQPSGSLRSWHSSPSRQAHRPVQGAGRHLHGGGVHTQLPCLGEQTLPFPRVIIGLEAEGMQLPGEKLQAEQGLGVHVHGFLDQTGIRHALRIWIVLDTQYTRLQGGRHTVLAPSTAVTAVSFLAFRFLQDSRDGAG